MHRHTPTLITIDPRGAVVRDIAYHRRSDKDAPQSRITGHIHDTLNRLSLSRDPRLFALFESGASQVANQATVSSLTGKALLSINVDAGWRLTLSGAAGQRLEDWDQKLNHLRIAYDSLMRPESGFEFTAGEERRTECFAYADASLEFARNNCCGQLIRQDDSAGTQRFREYSLHGAHLEQARCFLAHPGMPDWPEDEAGRDKLLEPQTAITRMRYNSVGELVRLIDALGNEQLQRRTVTGDLYETRMKLAGANEEVTLVGEICYNAFGQVEQQTAGNGVVTRTTFHPENGWLKTLRAQVATESPLQNLAYDYDPVGNPVSISDDAQPIHYFRNQRVAAINTYEYDTLGQLIVATGRQRVRAPGGPHLPEFVSPPDSSQLENYRQIFDYDAGGNLKTLCHQADSGNRTERTAVATLSNRSLPWVEGSERPGDDEIDAAYDVNGNLKTLQRGQTLQWDTRNCLLQVDQVIREDEPDDMESYVYDGDGQRVRKVRMTYTGTFNRTHETRYLPGVEIRTTPDETLHVISVQAGRCTVRILHWEKGQARGIPQNQLRYCLVDHLGSSSLELDKDAALISEETYYPYGATAWWAGRENVEAGYKTIRYSGQERDATGLYCYGFRYYIPWRQRWLSADPGGVEDGLNLFRMVGGNPVGYVDLLGLSKTRYTKADRVKAELSGVVRATFKAAAGYGAKKLAKKFLGQVARYPFAIMSGLVAAYAGGTAIARVMDSRGAMGLSKNLTVAGAGVIGFGVGYTIALATPDPLAVVHGVVKIAGSNAVGRMISRLGPSISPDITTRHDLVTSTFASLTGNVVKGMWSGIAPDSVHPILRSAAGNAIKNGVGTMIRAFGGVGSRFNESRHSDMLNLPTGENLIDAGKALADDMAMQLVYTLSNSEFDKGVTAVLGADMAASTLGDGLRQLRLSNEVGIAGQQLFKDRSIEQVGPTHKKIRRKIK